MSDPASAPAATPPVPPAGVTIVSRQDAPSQEQAGGLSVDEQRELGELIERRNRAAADSTVRLRVEAPHESVRVGHITVGRDWTDVPTHMVAALTEGAADAGVKITQEES